MDIVGVRPPTIKRLSDPMAQKSVLNRQPQQPSDSMKAVMGSTKTYKAWVERAQRHEIEVVQMSKHADLREKFSELSLKRSTTDQFKVNNPLRHQFRSLGSGRSRFNIAASPKMGSRIETFRDRGVPGPGSYQLPSQFA